MTQLTRKQQLQRSCALIKRAIKRWEEQPFNPAEAAKYLPIARKRLAQAREELHSSSKL